MRRINILLLIVMFLLSLYSVNAALTDGLRYYWKMDNNSTIDSLGILNLSRTSVTNTSGIINSGFGFGGTSNLNGTSTSLSWMTSGDWTVSMWVNSTNINSNQILQTNRDVGTGYGGIALSVYQQKFNVQVMNDGCSGFLINSQVGSIVTNNWTYLAVKRNGSNYSAYVNNNYYDLSDSANIICFGNMTFWLGDAVHAPGNGLIGSMDEVGIWNRSLNDTEIITQLYNNGSGLSYPFSTTPSNISVSASISPAIIYKNSTKHCNFTINSTGSYVNASVTWYTNISGSWARNNSYDYTFTNLAISGGINNTITGAGTGSFTGNLTQLYGIRCEVNASSGNISAIANSSIVTVTNRVPNYYGNVSLVNGTHYNTLNNLVINMTTNSSDPDGDILSCGIIITGNTTTNNIQIPCTGIPTIILSPFSNEGTSKAEFFVNDSYGGRNSTNITFIIDNTNPIVSSNFVNNTLFYGRNITGQFNFSDVNLYSWNISIDGVTIDNATNVAYTSYIYNLTRYSNLSAGRHILSVYVADAHTSNYIDEYVIDKGGIFDDSYLAFETKDNNIEISAKDKSFFDSFEYVKEEDRYTFKYIPYNDVLDLEIMKEQELYSKTFIIKTDQPINIVSRENTEYKKWIVSGNNWIDFYNPEYRNDLVEIIQISDYEAEVTIYYENVLTEFQFYSVGELNIVQHNYTFYTIQATTSYTTPVFEQAINTHSVYINFTNTTLTQSDINATLYYNNLSQTLVKTNDASSVTFTSDPTAPATNVNTNTSFYWNITVLGNPVYQINLTQEILAVSVQDCADNSSWYKAITFLIKDEEFLTNLTNVSMDIGVKINIGGTTKDYGFTFRDWWNYSLCVENLGTNYTIDAKIDYYSENYSRRKYHLYNYTLAISNDTLDLFLLDDDISSDIIILLYDKSTGDRITEAYVKMLRYYPNLDETGSSAYRTVEIELTDNDGFTGFKAVKADIWYKFIVEYPAGTVILNTEVEKILEDSKPLPVSLSEDSLLSYNEKLGISYDVYCTVSTKVCRFTWSNPTGTTVRGELRILVDNGYRKTLNYSAYLDTATGSIAYTIPGEIVNTKYIAEGKIYTQ